MVDYELPKFPPGHYSSAGASKAPPRKIPKAFDLRPQVRQRQRQRPVWDDGVITLQGINISHLGKRKIIFKMPFLGDMLIPWRVDQFLGSFVGKYTHLKTGERLPESIIPWEVCLVRRSCSISFHGVICR